MTTTTLLNTASADTSVTITLAAGETIKLYAVGLDRSRDEIIELEKPDGAGGWMVERDPAIPARLTFNEPTLYITGPENFRINKPATTSAVRIVRES